MAAIECTDLGRRYADVAAVEAVSFRVGRGEFFGLLGPNGAGKTTILHMLTTLIEPSFGRASVLGYDVRDDAQEVRRALGLVFQDPALDERLTARENLDIHAVLYDVPRRERADRVEESLAWASLRDAADRRVRTFSGGMKRRLELARALMHRPGVLFLDEPTLGLDPQGRKHLWERIDALRREGMTVLMTTHYLYEAEACDRVGIIDRGSLVALGSPADLIAGSENATDLEGVFLALTGHQLRDEAAGPRALMKSYADRGGEFSR
ncbi:MAG: ATP-binding cassette domain-containing protein [Trueperaceae bacterium]|nr:ATP-binding cassette domain-containing protein [Trueperaceae bacterium]